MDAFHTTKSTIKRGLGGENSEKNYKYLQHSLSSKYYIVLFLSTQQLFKKNICIPPAKNCETFENPVY